MKKAKIEKSNFKRDNSPNPYIFKNMEKKINTGFESPIWI